MPSLVNVFALPLSANESTNERSFFPMLGILIVYNLFHYNFSTHFVTYISAMQIFPRVAQRIYRICANTLYRVYAINGQMTIEIVGNH